MGIYPHGDISALPLGFEEALAYLSLRSRPETLRHRGKRRLHRPAAIARPPRRRETPGRRELASRGRWEGRGLKEPRPPKTSSTNSATASAVTSSRICSATSFRTSYRTTLCHDLPRAFAMASSQSSFFMTPSFCTTSRTSVTTSTLPYFLHDLLHNPQSHLFVQRSCQMLVMITIICLKIVRIKLLQYYFKNSPFVIKPVFC